MEAQPVTPWLPRVHASGAADGGGKPKKKRARRKASSWSWFWGLTV